MQYTVSARGKAPDVPILPFLGEEFPHVPMAEIESVFGFVEHCTLYGGRPFVGPELSQKDVAALKVCGIGVRLPLSNHSVTREEYERYRPFIARYHDRRNSVITTSDELARWIRQDFPSLGIEASVIKDIHTHDGVDRALEIYDTAVLPMRMNQDREFLEGIREKQRVTLFGNAGCALNCPARICYASFSHANKSKGAPIACSYGKVPRELLGMLDFDVRALAAMGFVRFKLLRTRAHGLTGF